MAAGVNSQPSSYVAKVAKEEVEEEEAEQEEEEEEGEGDHEDEVLDREALKKRAQRIVLKRQPKSTRRHRKASALDDD